MTIKAGTPYEGRSSSSAVKRDGFNNVWSEHPMTRLAVTLTGIFIANTHQVNGIGK
jgi:hypothetical protein